jgi:hypothetical protein
MQPTLSCLVSFRLRFKSLWVGGRSINNEDGLTLSTTKWSRLQSGVDLTFKKKKKYNVTSQHEAIKQKVDNDLPKQNDTKVEHLV